MNKWLKVALFSLLLIAISSAVATYLGYQSLTQYGEQALNIEKPQEIELKRGTGFYQFFSQLESQGLIKDTWKLKLLTKIRPEITAIRAGLYEIAPGDSLNKLLSKLVSGDQKSFSFTLVEGLTIKDWQAQLANLPRIDYKADLFNAVLKQNGDQSGLPEGKFYPETYHYYAGDSLKSILNQSYLSMAKALNNAWAQRSPGVMVKSPYELLILASIIEKETGKASERSQISAVFNNRLKKKMRLQTDPTVIYGMGERFQGDIRRKDLRQYTPFNTYRIKGLPPTPIAAPSEASLIAAAQPAEVDYLYFVSRNDGSHVFSKTLREHNRAVNQFQRNRK